MVCAEIVLAWTGGLWGADGPSGWDNSSWLGQIKGHCEECLVIRFQARA